MGAWTGGGVGDWVEGVRGVEKRGCVCGDGWCGQGGDTHKTVKGNGRWLWKEAGAGKGRSALFTLVLRTAALLVSISE